MKKRKGRSFQHPQNKGCIIRAAGIEEISYKDVEFLKKFISEKGKIIPSRVSGICKRNQKYLTTAIKQARVCGLLHFSNSKYDPFINDEPSTVLDLDFY